MTKYLPSFDELTDSQKELATEKIKRIESAIPHHEKALNGKYFPSEVGFCYDNIGSWFAVHRDNQVFIRCICYIGEGIVLNYKTSECPHFMDSIAIKNEPEAFEQSILKELKKR